jgi:hypothetical protein
MAKKKCDFDFSKCTGGCSGFGYFLGAIGAAIYYISTATGFWMGVLGLLKAIVWPVFLTHGLFKLIGM